MRLFLIVVLALAPLGAAGQSFGEAAYADYLQTEVNQTREAVADPQASAWERQQSEGRLVDLQRQLAEAREKSAARAESTNRRFSSLGRRQDGFGRRLGRTERMVRDLGPSVKKLGDEVRSPRVGLKRAHQRLNIFSERMREFNRKNSVHLEEERTNWETLREQWEKQDTRDKGQNTLLSENIRNVVTRMASYGSRITTTQVGVIAFALFVVIGFIFMRNWIARLGRRVSRLESASRAAERRAA